MYKAVVGFVIAAALSGCCGMGAGGCKPKECGGTPAENIGCERGCSCSCGCGYGKKVTY